MTKLSTLNFSVYVSMGECGGGGVLEGVEDVVDVGVRVKLHLNYVAHRSRIDWEM